MIHILEPFFCHRLLIRVEAEIHAVHLVVEELRVFKVGEIGFSDVEISTALTKDERQFLNQAVLDDYVACSEKEEESA